MERFHTYFRGLLSLIFLLTGCAIWAQSDQQLLRFYPADHKLIRYTGRVDFSNAKSPRFYQPGIYVDVRFQGATCNIILHDQQLWGKQNYFSLILDGQYRRLQTRAGTDTIVVASDLSEGWHTLRIVKETEANIGWLAFGGVMAEKLAKPPKRPKRRIEFIGDSITCGASSDDSEVPCGTGVWEDQHNAYQSFGPITARRLEAEWHLSSVSGFGLMRSCCGIEEVLPAHYASIDMRGDSLTWDFSRYQADLVVICLGQNDGQQDSTAFCQAYIDFIEEVSLRHPKAAILCISSPMADAALADMLRRYLNAVRQHFWDRGQKQVDTYFFADSYTNGCDFHPNVADHTQIAQHLADYIEQSLRW